MATLKEIAEICGVSTATVSYVASGRARAMKPETRERVTRKLKELKYHPNAHARGLQGLRTNTIGIVFDQQTFPFDNNYFGPILEGIMAGAAQRQFATLLFTDLTREEFETSAARLCDGRCDGFIVVAPVMDSRLVADLAARKIPTVVVGTHPENPTVSMVDADNVLGGKIATEFLIGLGHRKIGAIGLRKIQGSCTPERISGYRTAMQNASLELRDTLVADDSNGNPTDEEAIRSALGQGEDRPTAIFCTEATVALEAIRLAHQVGLRVPEDLSVVGFDDYPSTSLSQPTLTTIRQPMRTIGSTSVEVLVDSFDAETPSATQSILKVELVERGSTCPPQSSAYRNTVSSLKNPIQETPM